MAVCYRNKQEKSNVFLNKVFKKAFVKSLGFLVPWISTDDKVPLPENAGLVIQLFFSF